MEGIDLEALLAPLPGRNPAGEDLLRAGVYDDIREARRADDQLPAGIWAREYKIADWNRVISLATEALTTRTKDLQIGAWLAEALVQLHGFVGLRDGLKLMSGLELNFWHNLYPQLDDGDVSPRAQVVTWLDDKCSLAVQGIPLTNGASGPRYAYRHWQESLSFDIPPNLANREYDEEEKFADLRARAAAEGKITSEQWRSAKQATGRRFYEETYDALADCWMEFHELDAATTQMFGRQRPGLRLLQATLEDVRVLVNKIVLEKRGQEPGRLVPEVASQATGNSQPHLPIAPRRRTVAPAASREAAYQKLAEAAAYFREAEPLSPVPYLIERAIRWGQMPLESWLAEVVKSEDVLSNVWETLGIEPWSGRSQEYPSPDNTSDDDSG